MKTVRVSLDLIEPDPDQPRKAFDPECLAELADSIKRHGQHVPGIAYQHVKKARLLDGERRWKALRLAGKEDMTLILLSEMPTKAQLRIIQASIDVHRVGLNPMERSNNLAAIMAETRWTIGEMVEQLSIKQSLLSKLISYQRLALPVQELLATGALEMEKAYQISRIDDHAAQLEMVKQYAHLSREAIRAKIKGNGKPVVKTKRATFTLPGGTSVTIKGPDAATEEIIERLNFTVKQLLKLFSQGHEIAACERIMREKAAVNNAK